MEFQVRSETTGLQVFDSFSKAVTAALDDSSIWKISYTNEKGDRVRFVKTHNGWKLKDILDDIKEHLSL